MPLETSTHLGTQLMGTWSKSATSLAGNLVFISGKRCALVIAGACTEEGKGFWLLTDHVYHVAHREAAAGLTGKTRRRKARTGPSAAWSLTPVSVTCFSYHVLGTMPTHEVWREQLYIPGHQEQ